VPNSVKTLNHWKYLHIYTHETIKHTQHRLRQTVRHRLSSEKWIKTVHERQAHLFCI